MVNLIFSSFSSSSLTLSSFLQSFFSPFPIFLRVSLNFLILSGAFIACFLESYIKKTKGCPFRTSHSLFPSFFFSLPELPPSLTAAEFRVNISPMERAGNGGGSGGGIEGRAYRKYLHILKCLYYYKRIFCDDKNKFGQSNVIQKGISLGNHFESFQQTGFYCTIFTGFLCNFC